MNDKKVTFVEEFNSFKDMFKEISVCVAYDPDRRVILSEIDSYQKNMADYTMMHLPLHNIDVFAISESETDYLMRALEKAKSNGKKYLLYMQVGNLTEWPPDLYKEIYKQLYSDDYKFIGHVLEYYNGSFYIHPQFFVIDVDWAIANNVNVIEPQDDKTWTGYKIERSEENFHDGYTPTWVKGTDTLQEFKGRGAGWSIVDKLAATKVNFAPWCEAVRNNKQFTYNYVDYEESLRHKQICLDFGNESRTFVANTEVINSYLPEFVKSNQIKQMVVPASGANTFLYPYFCGLENVIVYDKNLLSIEVFRSVFRKWNGENYKEFLKSKYNTDNKNIFAVPHYLDSDDERIKNFGQDFIDWWQKNKSHSALVHLDIFNQNHYNRLLRLLENKPILINLSNILHYHPTSLFYSTEEKYILLQQFKKKLETKIAPENLFFIGADPLTKSKIQGYYDISNYDFKTVRSYPWRKK